MCETSHRRGLRRSDFLLAESVNSEDKVASVMGNFQIVTHNDVICGYSYLSSGKGNRAAIS